MPGFASNYGTGTGPSSLAFDGTNIWVANFGGTDPQTNNQITVRAAANGALVATYRTLAFGSSNILFAAGSIWISGRYGSVYAWAAGTYAVGDVISDSNGFIQVCVAPGATGGTEPAWIEVTGELTVDGGMTWENFGPSDVPGIVQKFAVDGTSLGVFSCGNAPSAITFDGTNIWIVNANDDTVTKLLAATGATLGTFAVGSQAFINNGTVSAGLNIWISDGLANTLTELLASTGTLLNTYPIPGTPSSICFDGTNLWVCCPGNATLVQVDPLTGTILQSLHIAIPNTVFFDGTYLWLASGSGSLIRLTTGGAILDTFGPSTVDFPYDSADSPIGLTFDGTDIWGGLFGSNRIYTGNAGPPTPPGGNAGPFLGTFVGFGGAGGTTGGTT